MSRNSKSNLWFSAKVIAGKKIAKTLGFPTINLDNVAQLEGEKEGVHAALVKIEGKIHQGVLYFGPRLILNEKEKIVEIFILDYESDLYGREVQFQLKGFVRAPENFPDIDEFKNQLVLDCQIARKILK